MEWIILFIINVIVFIIAVDWKNLKINIFCGIFAAVLQLAVDSQAISHGFYKINNAVIQIWGSSLFFVLGPVLIIGTLFAQVTPKNRWMNVAEVLVFALLFSIAEYFLLLRNALEYMNWHMLDSVVVNISAMIMLNWFSLVILKKEVNK